MENESHWYERNTVMEKEQKVVRVIDLSGRQVLDEAIKLERRSKQLLEKARKLTAAAKCAVKW
jgi:hypothetical protein